MTSQTKRKTSKIHVEQSDVCGLCRTDLANVVVDIRHVVSNGITATNLKLISSGNSQRRRCRTKYKLPQSKSKENIDNLSRRTE